jgi:hypothetical protein
VPQCSSLPGLQDIPTSETVNKQVRNLQRKARNLGQTRDQQSLCSTQDGYRHMMQSTEEGMFGLSCLWTWKFARDLCVTARVCCWVSGFALLFDRRVLFGTFQHS